METYFLIVNILDSYAESGQPLDGYALNCLDRLAASGQHTIEDIGDANDVPNAKTWADIVDGFRALYKSGDRVRV